MPLILKSHGSSGPPGVCYVGRVLSDDTFEGGGSEGPFINNGTDTVHRQPWNRDNNSSGIRPFPKLPGKVSLDEHGRPGQDGIRFGYRNDNQVPDDDLNDVFDQVIWKQIAIPAGTGRINVSFDMLMESKELSPSDPAYNGEVYDRFFLDLRENLYRGYNTSAKFECNNTRCSLSGRDNYIRTGWFRPITPITFNPPLVEERYLHLTFWANVNHRLETSFFIDNFRIIIVDCN